MPSCSMQDSEKVIRRVMNENIDDVNLLDKLLEVQEDSDVDFLSDLLEQGDTVPKRRAKKSLTDVRSLENWIKLQHTSQRVCEVPLHESVSDRPRNQGMTVIIGNVAVCRLCFLESADLET